MAGRDSGSYAVCHPELLHPLRSCSDVTGNDTAGMVAGMVASGVTAKGLNGIEAEANKLAKAPKGIDGVTEGTGNVAEDVGKVVEW